MNKFRLINGEQIKFGLSVKEFVNLLRAISKNPETRQSIVSINLPVEKCQNYFMPQTKEKIRLQKKSSGIISWSDHFDIDETMIVRSNYGDEYILTEVDVKKPSLHFEKYEQV